MSYSNNPGVPVAYNAGADLTGKQYTIMIETAESTCNIASLATDSLIIGVLQNKPALGDRASVADDGVSKVVAGGAITVGLHITANSSGKAAAVGSGDIAIGRLLAAAGADGDIVPVRLYTPVRWSGAA
jgi:hypothetical protein